MVVFVNTLRLTGDASELEAIYRDVAAHFSRQAGLIGFRLLRSTEDPAVYVNVAEWRDVESFRAATRHPAFRGARRISEVSAGDPHLCETVLEGGPA
ncbi:hypothetical protein GCM10009836_35410 [Pseudonocardia ailaonensis]|uniref:ABM domain-containing protein n=1 Tax=Pseudonocardia ailaonensis TaxID=367279 RepID=A0ABN2N4L6_9PSEU